MLLNSSYSKTNPLAMLNIMLIATAIMPPFIYNVIIFNDYI